MNRENLENIRDKIDNKLSGISANNLLCAGAGAFILSSGLKMLGNDQAGSFVGKLFIPLLAIGLYKKYKDHSRSQAVAPTAYNEPDPDSGYA